MASTWRESLLPASFRGVRFVIESSSVPTGRKGQLHEYPQRDEPFFEQLGKRAQVHKLSAFVIGEDCFERRDQLLQALEAEGPGELVHPWLGRMQVLVGECDLQHERREGGMARFDLTFYPERPRTFPAARVNTQQQVNKASEGGLASGLARYRAAMAKVDAARINVIALRNSLSGAYMAIQRQFAPFLDLYSNLDSFAHSLVNAPFALSSMLSGYFSELSGGARPVSSDTGYRNAIGSATRHVAAVKSVNTVSHASGADTGAVAEAVANLVQDALLVQVALIIAQMPITDQPVSSGSVLPIDQQALQPVVRPEVPVADDVIELRDTLADAIWQAALKADVGHYQALNSLRQTLIKHLSEVAKSGVRLVEIKPAETTPALVLAYRRFGDATRAGEVVQRNRITHPGFVPPLPLKVAQR